jgi:hypothetical protein
MLSTYKCALGLLLLQYCIAKIMDVAVTISLRKLTQERNLPTAILEALYRLELMLILLG